MYEIYRGRGGEHRRLIKAKQCAEKSNSKVFLSSDWVGYETDYIKFGNYDISSDLYCEFMGYWLSEGSVTCRRDNGRKLVSISQHKYYNKMRKCVEKLPVSVWGKKKHGYMSFYDDSIYDYLYKFGKANQKHIPEEIKKLSPRLINIFIDAYVLGDGSTRIHNTVHRQNFISVERVIRTSSDKMASDFTEIIIKAGWALSYRLDEFKGKIVHWHNGDYIGNNDIWTIRIKNKRYASANKKFVKRIQYDGDIYDVELPKDHVLLVRRGGKVAWSGNCRCRLVAWYPEYAELEEDINS